MISSFFLTYSRDRTPLGAFVGGRKPPKSSTGRKTGRSFRHEFKT
uniref:Uncharacterized protein n=1 Tax=Siphoviridae sp. ctC4e1 TaxID=2825375 RepID=A0A8S5VHZ5_9CAUD|nr:MAG TPA: hypothetical protein [Siphoviridae sp. ctC4e1]